jgi:hypothetical protein
MQHWKIALSLAVVGAVAAPFVFHTNKADPRTWKPITAEERSYILRYLKETNNCQTESNDIAKGACNLSRYELESGDSGKTQLDLPKYLAINATVAGVAFGVIYGLAFLLPALARRYWKWLNA